MAILATYTTQTGIELQGAYITVKRVYTQKDKIKLEEGSITNNFTAVADIEVYASQEAYENQKPFVEEFREAFVFNIDSEDNVITQTYNHLKTQKDRFLNVIDI